MLCALFSFFVAISCGADEPVEPERTPTPTVQASPTPEPTPDTRRTSTDGKSLWEAKWEEMTGRTFVRRPLTAEQIAAKEADAGSEEGRFIYIPNRP